MNSQKAVFEFGNEYTCTNFFDIDLQVSGVDVSFEGEHIGSIIGVTITDDIDDVDSNEEFDNQVIQWIIENAS